MVCSALRAITTNTRAWDRSRGRLPPRIDCCSRPDCPRSPTSGDTSSRRERSAISFRSSSRLALDGMPAGLIYRGLGLTQSNLQNPNVWRASASYVTGSNGLKIRVSGRLSRLEYLQQRRSDQPRISVQQRRAQSIDDVHSRLGHVGQDPVRRAVCAGSVDRPSPHTAGRDAI